MKRFELVERGMDEANICQVFTALLEGVKIDFLRVVLEERRINLEIEIHNSPALYVVNGMFKVDWGYYDRAICTKLDNLLYEYNALKSACCKL